MVPTIMSAVIELAPGGASSWQCRKSAVAVVKMPGLFIAYFACHAKSRTIFIIVLR